MGDGHVDLVGDCQILRLGEHATRSTLCGKRRLDPVK
jgi:hypothetical protein